MCEGLCWLTGARALFLSAQAMDDVKAIWSVLQDECRNLLSDVLGAPRSITLLVEQNRVAVEAKQQQQEPAAGKQGQNGRPASLSFELLQAEPAKGAAAFRAQQQKEQQRKVEGQMDTVQLLRRALSGLAALQQRGLAAGQAFNIYMAPIVHRQDDTRTSSSS